MQRQATRREGHPSPGPQCECPPPAEVRGLTGLCSPTAQAGPHSPHTPPWSSSGESSAHPGADTGTWHIHPEEGARHQRPVRYPRHHRRIPPTCQPLHLTPRVGQEHAGGGTRLTHELPKPWHPLMSPRGHCQMPKAPASPSPRPILGALSAQGRPRDARPSHAGHLLQ